MAARRDTVRSRKWRPAQRKISSGPKARIPAAWARRRAALSTAIGNMQETLRELVGHIQGPSRSVADSADEMQESSANVSASAENIERSMARISEGAEHQLQLVERAHELIQKIAISIQSSAQTATSAADTATATSTAAQAARAAPPPAPPENQKRLPP